MSRKIELSMREEFLDNGGDGSAFGAAGQCGRGGPHDAPHILDAGGAFFFDESFDFSLELLGRECLRKIALEGADLCQLAFG